MNYKIYHKVTKKFIKTKKKLSIKDFQIIGLLGKLLKIRQRKFWRSISSDLQ